MFKQQTAFIDALNTPADPLNKMREAKRVEAILGPTNTEAYKDQADLVLETQETVSRGT